MFSVDDFLYDKTSHKYIRVENGANIPAKAINTLVGEVEELRASDWYLLRNCPYAVDGRTYIPGQPRIVKGIALRNGVLMEDETTRMYNEYLPPRQILDSWEGDVSEYQKLLAAMNDIDREDFLDRLAYNIQNPGKKANGIYVLSGPQGHGKDSVFYPLSQYLKGLMRITDLDEIMSHYSPWAKANVTIINETSSSTADSVKLYERLKPFSVNQPEFIVSKQKYEKTMMIANAVTIYMTTNHPTSLYFEPDDRRVTMIEFGHPERPKPEFFKAYYDAMDSGGWKAVIHWLSRRDISHFVPTSPARNTSLKDRVAEIIATTKRCEIGEVIETYIEQKERPFVVLISEIGRYITEVIEDKLKAQQLVRKLSHNHKLALNILNDLGYVPNGRIEVAGKNVRGVYYRPDLCDQNREHFEQVAQTVRRLQKAG